ncbi:MAG: hypothetical protein Q7U38_01385 [Methylobacter sp.]|nr:hypothetical protein [Methylobacter sp.]MDP2100410.1 hypothetical protein [Methylobacter sp.]MDP2427896.1 hypothetical protein [Methylobacter sp.]MDP3053882.1 hypothetical protein [Methylobacter sp.]MDP3363586.1 hypothetical protein [Methylobacter sp.]
MQSQNLYLIHSDSLDAKQVSLITKHPLMAEYNVDIRPIKLMNLNALNINEKRNQALVWVSQAELQCVITAAYNKKLTLSFLPLPNDSRPVFFDHFDLPVKLNDCLVLALTTEPVAVDLIRCNGELLSQDIGLMGQTAFAELVESGNNQRFWKKNIANIQRLLHAFSLRPIPIQLETAKGKSVKTAIVGFYLLDMAKTSAFTKLFDDSVSLKDGRISLMLFAPQSILGYIQSSLPFVPSTQKKLTEQLGFVRSTSVRLTTQHDTDYWIENKIVRTRELVIENMKGALNIHVGNKFREIKPQSDDKENFSVEYLPQQNARLKYLSKTLPFFQHALESDFKDLFLILKNNAKTTNTYLLLMVLSSLLATLGLFLNSPSVVIGAMVLAPLMAPIISLSMGLLRSDKILAQQSVLTLISMFQFLSLEK